MGWEGSSLQISSVVSATPVVATNHGYPLQPPDTAPTPYDFTMRCSGVAAGTRLLFVLAKGDGRLLDYEVVPCFGLKLAGPPDVQTATFQAYFNQRAAGTYHLVMWAKTDETGAWVGHQQSVVFENAIDVARDPGAADPT